MKSYIYYRLLILCFLLSIYATAQTDSPNLKENHFPEILDSIPLKTYWSASSNMPYENAMVEFKNNNFEKAVKIYNSILISDPDEHVAIYNRGLCYYKMRDSKLCCSDFKYSAYLQNPDALKNYKSFCDSSIDINSFYDSAFVCPEFSQSFKTLNESFDSKPEFPGGTDSLYSFIINNLRSGSLKNYSFDAKDRKLIKYMIDKDGAVIKQTFVDKKEQFNNEIITMYPSIPKWKPAYKNGQPVKSNYIFPVINGRVFIKEGNKFYNKGVELFGANKLNESISYFNTAILFNQKDYEAFYNRGVCFYKMKNTSDACLDWGNAYLIKVDKQLRDLINKYCDSTIVFNGQKTKIYSIDDQSKEKVFVVVEEMPKFPGGDEQLFQFISRNIKYPDKARKAGIIGRVYVTFVIDKNGNVQDAKVLRGIGSGCDEAALDLIRSMPQWTPGKQNGKVVNVQYNIPINFNMK